MFAKESDCLNRLTHANRLFLQALNRILIFVKSIIR